MHGSSGTTADSPRTTPWAGSVKLHFAATTMLILLLVAAIVWIKTATWNRVRNIQQEFATIRTEAFYLGTRLQGGVWRLNGRLLRFQLTQDSAERDGFQREARELTDWLARTLPKVLTTEERDLARQVQMAFDQYLTETSPLLERGLRQIRKDSASSVYQQIAEKSAPLIQICERLVSCQDAALSQRFSVSGAMFGELRALMRYSTWLLLGCTAAIALLAYKAVVAPLRLQLGRTEQAVLRHEKLASLGTLAAGVAHEIRNPLTAIRFRLFSFKKELPEAYAEHEDLAVIHGEIDRLERIVDNFLQFARPSEPQLSPVEARQVLQKIHDLLSGSLSKQGVALKLELPEPMKVKADSQQLQQVLINLVQNAADSIGHDGTVTLRASSGVGNLQNQSRPVVVFDVADTGKGIPPEVEQRIFDPFFSTKEGGTGLGLAIAARIAEQHGGTIQYHSHPKRGTTFSLVLPRITDDANPNPPH